MFRQISKQQLFNALLGALCFFLILCAYYILKPLRDSSFLTSFHPNAKPLFNLVTMSILFFVASGYSLFLKVVPAKRFLSIFYGIVVSNLLIFWGLFAYMPAITGAVFYTWLSVANVFLVTIFWTQINSAFTGKYDKFLYVIVGLGGGLGATFGAKSVKSLVPLIGSNNLIPCAIFVLFLSFLCSSYIAKISKSVSFLIPKKEHERANFKGLLAEKYAVCILALVVIGTFVQTIYDYQLTVMVSEAIEKSKDAYSMFYGSLYYRMNAFSFFAQIFIGPVILFSVGPARGLYLFLFLIIGSAIALTMNNTLPVMEWVFIIFVGSGYSIVQIFREQLYVPASQTIKVSCKGFIDTFGFRMGDAIAAISFVVLVTIFGVELVRLDYLVLLSGLFAAYYLVKANKIYQEMVDKGANKNIGNV